MRFQEASERILIVEFAPPQDTEIQMERVMRIQRLVSLLDRGQLNGILDLTPAYNSLTIEYDACRLDSRDLIEHVRFCAENIGSIELPAVARVEIPVFYGGEFGPDLPWCAEYLGMTVSQLVEAHCEQLFTVAFFGFLPGFAYLAGWPAKWSLPRLESPRAKVAAGSVALAGMQAGIYPLSSPGGWRVLGRTPLPMIEVGRIPFATLEMGAQVRFYPSNPKAW